MVQNAKPSPRDDIKRVARELLKQGIRPSQSSVKEHLDGNSSNTTITAALQEFWKELAEDLTQAETRPDVPEALFDIVLQLWGAAVEGAEAHARQRIEKAIEIETIALDKEREARAELTGVIEKNESLQRQLDDAKALLDKQQASGTELSTLLAAAQKTIQKKDEDIRLSIDKHADYRDIIDQRFREKDDHISDLNRKLNATTEECQRLTNSLAGARHQVTNLEKYRDLYTREQEAANELKANNDALHSENRALSDRLIAAQEKSDELRNRFDSRIDQVMDEAKADREGHAKEVASLQKGKAELQELHDSLQQALNEKIAENALLLEQMEKLKKEIAQLNSK